MRVKATVTTPIRDSKVSVDFEITETSARATLECDDPTLIAMLRTLDIRQHIEDAKDAALENGCTLTIESVTD